MAQIGMAAPTNLIEMFSSPSMLIGDIAQSQVDQYRKTNEINQQQALADLWLKQQTNPIEVQQKQAALDTTLAQLPGVRGVAEQQANAGKMSTEMYDENKRKALADIAKSVSASDLDVAESKVKLDMLSSDPAKRAQATQMFSMLSDVRKQQMQLEEERKTRLATGAQTIAGNKQLEQMRIDAGKYDKQKQVGDVKSIISMQLSKAKSAKDQYAILTRAAVVMQQAGEAAEALQYQAQADALEPAARAELNAQPKPGTVDLGGIGNVPVNPTLQLRNPSAPGAAEQPQVQKEYTSENDVNNAIAQGLLKPGDIVTINGRKARIK